MSQHCWRLRDVIWHKVVSTEGFGKKKKKQQNQVQYSVVDISLEFIVAGGSRVDDNDLQTINL